MTTTKPKRQSTNPNEGSEAPEAVVVEETAAAPAEAPKAPRGVAMTIDRFVIITKAESKAALINSFAVCERLARGASIKRTSDEWRAAFDAWCREPRT